MKEKEGIFNSLLDEEKSWVRVDWMEASSVRLTIEGCGGCVIGGTTVEGSYEMPEELWRSVRGSRRRTSGTSMKGGANEDLNDIVGLLFHYRYVDETIQFVFGGVMECSACRRGGWT